VSMLLAEPFAGVRLHVARWRQLISGGARAVN
jgi:hypothetical protein